MDKESEEVYKKKCLDFQLELLKDEIQTINGVIGRMDTITQATKNWSIVTWLGSIGFMLGNAEAKPLIAATAILPLIFWIIDATWRRLQKRSVYRAKKITEFINDGRLLASFEKTEIQNFTVLDPIGHSHKQEAEYQSYVTMKNTLFFREVWVIYWSLAFISLILGIYVNFF